MTRRQNVKRGGTPTVPGSRLRRAFHAPRTRTGWHRRNSLGRAYAGVPGMTQKGSAASSLQSASEVHAMFELLLEHTGWPVSVTKHSPSSVAGIKGQTT